MKEYLCRECWAEFPESECTAIIEEEQDICPFCGKVLTEEDEM